MTKVVEPLEGESEGAVPLAPAPDTSWTLQPWVRSLRESDRDWAFFCAYRDSAYPNGPFGEGRRKRVKLADLAAMYDLKPVSLYKVSTNFSWEWRCASYDRYLDRERLEASRSLLERTKAAHERILGTTQEIVENELTKLLARSQDPETPAMTPRELQTLLKLLVEQQRLLAGQSTVNVAVAQGQVVDLTRLTYEQLMALKTATDVAGIQVQALPGNASETSRQ
jgi:hypothetical protein